MPKTYKILLSAYSCEPNKGSEPGVGWNWAIEIAKRGHEVWILTRKNNKSSIYKYFHENRKPNNLHFIFYDLPSFFLFLKKRFLGVNVYYFLWQVGIVSFAKKKHSKIKFDLVHHITFGVFRHPSFLYKLKVPIVFGPVGGGEQSTHALKKSLPFRYKLSEKIRESINLISRVNPLLLKSCKRYSLIYTKTDETKEFIKFKEKTKTYLEIGIDSFNSSRITNKFNHSTFSILYVGRFSYMKGFDIAFASYNKFRHLTKSQNQLSLIGKGQYLNRIQKSIKKLKIENNVNLINWVPRDKLKKYYQSSDIFLFPSLHDSSGNVVLEALSYGLPVICLDLGGPSQIVNNSCGRVISTKRKTEEEVIISISEAIFELENNRMLLKRLSEGAIKRAKDFTWTKTVDQVYSEIETFMLNSKK